MDIEMTNVRNQSSKWFYDVKKVIFHNSVGSVEYTNINCINHSEPATTVEIVTSQSEASFSLEYWYISKASQ